MQLIIFQSIEGYADLPRDRYVRHVHGKVCTSILTVPLISDGGWVLVHVTSKVPPKGEDTPRARFG